MVKVNRRENQRIRGFKRKRETDARQWYAQLVQKRKDVDLTRRQEGDVLLVQHKDRDAVFYRTDSGYKELTERPKSVELLVTSGNRKTIYYRCSDGALGSYDLYKDFPGGVLKDWRT